MGGCSIGASYKSMAIFRMTSCKFFVKCGFMFSRGNFSAILIIIVLLMNCTSLTITNRNATEPVMIGKLHRIGDSSNPDKPSQSEYRTMDLDKYWRVVFLLFAYQVAGTSDHNFQDIADMQYASAVEKTRCSHAIKALEFKTYSTFSIVLSAYINRITAISEGPVKCAK